MTDRPAVTRRTPDTYERTYAEQEIKDALGIPDDEWIMRITGPLSPDVRGGFIVETAKRY